MQQASCCCTKNHTFLLWSVGVLALCVCVYGTRTSQEKQKNKNRSSLLKKVISVGFFG
jgi:hypothetical protein